MKYLALCEFYKEVEATSKRLEKTYLTAKLIKKINRENLDYVMLLLEGRVFPAWEKEKKLGVADRTIIKAISIVSGISNDKIENKWKRTGDLGLVAEEYIGAKKQITLFSSELTVKKVFTNLQKLSGIEGEGAVDKKIKLIAELLSSAKPLEAKYIVRTVLEELRVGIGAGGIRDAIVWALFPQIKELELTGDGAKYYFEKETIIDKKITKKEEFKEIDIHKFKGVSCSTKELARELFNYFLSRVERAYNISNDWSVVVDVIFEKGLHGLEEVSLVPGRPIKVMLYQKAKNIKDAFEKLGMPCAFEYKYDGVRLEIHVIGKKIKLYTRRFEDVTLQFPDVVEYAKRYVTAKEAILDSETVGFNKKTTQYLPFQKISQRIKRKYDIDKLAKEYPVEVNVFDVMYYNGNSTIKMPFHERRKLLSRIVEPHPRKIVMSRIMITGKEDEANKFYQEALDAGNEGVMAKNLNAEYKPGSRVGYGVKVKPVMESLDLVIVGAEWGEGKRSGWLTSYIIACKERDELKTIGKVSTGVKELEEEGTSYKEMTNILKPLVKSEKGRAVIIKPEVVIEVSYEEIQKSPTYASGFALRFPRFVRLREDKGIEDASSLRLVNELYKEQRKGK